MSTILKTLKKLEEEKSVLDQKLDLEGMVLKEETNYLKILENKRRRFFLNALIVTAVLITGGVYFYYWSSPDNTSKSSKRITTKALTQQKQTPKTLTNPRTFEGVSMAGIPNSNKEPTIEAEMTYPSLKKLENETTPEKLNRLKKTVPSKRFTQLLPQENLPAKVSSEFEEIENLIKVATTSAKNGTDSPTAIRSGHIPGIKVKGIIFFNAKSLSNHIIVTTPKNSNLKLRLGDSTQHAVLKSIHPNRVIFLYQDQLIEVGIGQ